MLDNYKRYEMMSARILFTHGFLPHGYSTWEKRSSTALTTANMVGKSPVLCLELQTIGSQGIMQSVRKRYVNLTETNEDGLKATINAFKK